MSTCRHADTGRIRFGSMENAYISRLSLVARMGRLRLRQLEILLTIAEHLTLTGAAQALSSTQPAMSQVLIDVESALGVQLFSRGRRLQPTPFLEPVLRYARRALTDAGQLADDLRMAGIGWAGRVRVGSMMVGTAELVPQTITSLRAAGSQVEIEVHEDIAAGLWPRLERDEIDILIGRLDPGALSHRIKFEALFEDDHRVVVGVRHPLAEDPNADLAAAARYPWALPPQGTLLRKVIDENFATAGIPRPFCWQESGSITLNLATVASSQCVFVTAMAPARFYAAAGMLFILPIRLERDLGPVGMAWHARENIPLLQFQATLRAVAARLEERNDFSNRSA